MPEFKTEVPLFPASSPITYQEPVLCMGSCFAEHIGRRLMEYRFPCLLNPFGILYNPASIARALQRLLTGPAFQAEELFEHQELWHCFWHHGTFSHPVREESLRTINAAFEEARSFLPAARRLILTLGTAFIYEHRQDGAVVANCHQLPASSFNRRRLGVEEAAALLAAALEKAREKQPALEVILTVSPVRHLRDGLVENQRSKAILLLAVEELCRRFSFVHYFPAYEIVMDELRGYRFYAADMAHPNELAIDYIWQRFGAVYFPAAIRQLMQRIGKLLSAARHRPFHPQTAAHQQFLKKQLSLVGELEKEFPFLELRELSRHFEAQLLDNDD